MKWRSRIEAGLLIFKGVRTFKNFVLGRKIPSLYIGINVELNSSNEKRSNKMQYGNLEFSKLKQSLALNPLVTDGETGISWMLAQLPTVGLTKRFRRYIGKGQNLNHFYQGHFRIIIFLRMAFFGMEFLPNPFYYHYLLLRSQHIRWYQLADKFRLAKDLKDGERADGSNLKPSRRNSVATASTLDTFVCKHLLIDSSRGTVREAESCAMNFNVVGEVFVFVVTSEAGDRQSHIRHQAGHGFIVPKDRNFTTATSLSSSREPIASS
ncbi:uncharacterized protein BDR25DRAFT_358358 [Lindgomyces ingoldianus]|uniref:Uncharacterized protein n=1 Tax=Lindgomyces ingoldianus TaxID=673940 RepID=A0ACB6QL43_9PLEO|nr:uncharacterized protein BDR25DRAFT_358358 [Lindgomyces ingoldianus]KAF2467679.1 hypothetical protein BDR25DRAFT_358358 [Lindgomyces ingoldianus]